MPITTEIAKRSGELRGQLTLIRKTHTQADTMIAATAQIHQVTLVRRNIRDFDSLWYSITESFYIKLRWRIDEILAGTKKYAIGQERANHLTVMENR